MSVEESAAAFSAMGRVARRWVVANVALEHAAALAESPPDGLKAVRTGAWVKIGPTPQMTGDRPAQGFEAIAILHADGEGSARMWWNGGGRAAVYHFQAEMRGVYPTQKPEPLVSRLLHDFADPGDDVLDPFCGSGTTLVCAWRLGHRAVGCDVREEALEISVRRLEAAMRQGRMPSAARAPTMADQRSLV
jgi:site-specific DNA-methyltransferase (adenine-specific)